MKYDEQSLPKDAHQLQEMVLALQSQVHALQRQSQLLLEHFRLAKQKRFGTSSESHPEQGELFNEAELEVEAIEEHTDTQTISYTRKTPKRQLLPKDLPREIVVHDISEQEKVCQCCGSQLHQMGDTRSEKLEFVPAQVKVIEHVRLKYSCRKCEKQGIEANVKIAPLPVSPIPKGIATASLLSQIITSKYQYGLPLYRQQSLFKQYGIELNRCTMADWMIKCSSLFKPLIEKLKAIQLQQPVILADETTLNVINEHKSTCYMWLYCTGADPPNDSPIPNIVLYDYHNNRSGRCAVDYLGDYSGYLQVDGYQGYEQTQATLVGCWAHARRKFKEAEIVQGKNKTGKATWALNHIQKLYRIEAHIKGLSAEQKYQVRQNESLPLLNQYKLWLEKSALQVPAKTAIGKAIHYNLRQWPKLIRYIEDGHLNIDNNRAERAIKPFVIGRKNWLFSNTANGANASAILYSIIETAKANGLTPFDYIVHCLEHLAASPKDIEPLLPWKVNLGSVV